MAAPRFGSLLRRTGLGARLAVLLAAGAAVGVDLTSSRTVESARFSAEAMPSPSSLAQRSCAARDETAFLLARLLTCSRRYCLGLRVFVIILSSRSVSSLRFAMLQCPLDALADFGNSPGVHAQ